MYACSEFDVKFDEILSKNCKALSLWILSSGSLSNRSCN